MPSTIGTETLLTSHEVSELTGIQYKHLWTYMQRGVMPEPYIHIGNKPLWKQAVIEEWQATRPRRSVKETSNA